MYLVVHLFNAALELDHALVSCELVMYLVVHLFNAMHCGSVFRIEFLHTDRVRHNSARIGSFSKF